MPGAKGKVEREGEVVYPVARHLCDPSADLASVGDRESASPLPRGRGDRIAMVVLRDPVRASCRLGA